jgi:hypothetical protein
VVFDKAPPTAIRPPATAAKSFVALLEPSTSVRLHQRLWVCAEQQQRPAEPNAVALNRKILDIAQRNMSSGFDLAKSLAGAKNLADFVELQTAPRLHLLL